MLILIKWHKNISVQTVACIVKHEDPHMNSVRGVCSKVKAGVQCTEWSCNLACVQIYSTDEYTESLKL